jgi:methionyl aminopeptidase
MKQRRRKKKKPKRSHHGAPILTAAEIDKMRAAGRLAAAILDDVQHMIAPGVSTMEIDQRVDELTRQAGAISATLGYHGYPAHCCTSINDVVCHGIPAHNDVLAEGDIINVDVTPVLEGFHGDTSRTFMVGNVSPDARALVETTYKAMWLGIESLHGQGNVADIGRAIQPYVEKHGYSVVREFTGHGLGREFHTPPTVFHHVTLGGGMELTPGMALTVEPMINAGRWKTRVLDDGWTAKTVDGKLSAQFEHTVVITEDGTDVMTLGEGEVPPKA